MLSLKLLAKSLGVLIIAFLMIEAYYQVVYRLAIVPSFLRIYDFRYFDNLGTPRFPPGLKAWHRASGERPDVLIHINSQGFRGAEPLNDSTTRIVMIGDSTVFNGGVELEKTFPVIVQERLRQELNSAKIEVLNFGVGDINANQGYLKLKNHALSYSPDLILFFVYLNDTIDSLSPSVSTLAISPTMPWYHSIAAEQLTKLFKNYYLLLEIQRTGRLGWTKEFQSREYLHNPERWREMLATAQYDWGAAWNMQSWGSIREIFEEVAAISKQHRAEVIFVLLPVSPQVELPIGTKELFSPQDHTRSIADELGIALLDPLPFFRGHDKRGEMYYDQCHFTETGNMVMADFLVPRITEWFAKLKPKK